MTSLYYRILLNPQPEFHGLIWADTSHGTRSKHHGDSPSFSNSSSKAYHVICLPYQKAQGEGISAIFCKWIRSFEIIIVFVEIRLTSASVVSFQDDLERIGNKPFRNCLSLDYLIIDNRSFNLINRKSYCKFTFSRTCAKVRSTLGFYPGG